MQYSPHITKAGGSTLLEYWAILLNLDTLLKKPSTLHEIFAKTRIFYLFGRYYHPAEKIPGENPAKLNGCLRIHSQM
jgi:hypothetical protein